RGHAAPPRGPARLARDARRGADRLRVLLPGAPDLLHAVRLRVAPPADGGRGAACPSRDLDAREVAPEERFLLHFWPGSSRQARVRAHARRALPAQQDRRRSACASRGSHDGINAWDSKTDPAGSKYTSVGGGSMLRIRPLAVAILALL